MDESDMEFRASRRQRVAEEAFGPYPRPGDGTPEARRIRAWLIVLVVAAFVTMGVLFALAG